jgi:hypothetical protein
MSSTTLVHFYTSYDDQIIMKYALDVTGRIRFTIDI